MFNVVKKLLSDAEEYSERNVVSEIKKFKQSRCIHKDNNVIGFSSSDIPRHQEDLNCKWFHKYESKQ